MNQTRIFSTNQDFCFFNDEKDHSYVSNKKTNNKRYITLAFIVTAVFSIAIFARLNFVEKNNNEHIANMATKSLDSLFDRNTTFIKGTRYLHKTEDALLLNFMNNHLPLIKQYATNKDYKNFTYQLKGKNISDIIEWEKNESQKFMKNIIYQKTKFDNILKNPQVTQSLTKALINNQTLSLYVKVTNNSPYNYNAIQGKLHIINIFEEKINESDFSLIKNISPGQTIDVIYDIANFKKFDITPEELMHLNITSYISKISTYDNENSTLLVYPYPLKTF